MKKHQRNYFLFRNIHKVYFIHKVKFYSYHDNFSSVDFTKGLTSLDAEQSYLKFHDLSERICTLSFSKIRELAEKTFERWINREVKYIVYRSWYTPKNGESKTK